MISGKALVRKEKRGRNCLLCVEISAYHVESPGDLCQTSPSLPFPLRGSLGAVLGCPLALRGSEEGSSLACPQLADSAGQEPARSWSSLPVDSLMLIRTRAQQCSLLEWRVALSASLWSVKKVWNDIFLLVGEIQVLSGLEISMATGEQGETMTL